MNWGIVHDGLLDELEKIKLGEFSLQGLSPQTVIERGQPAPPMETTALNRALQILNRYDAMQPAEKTAAPSLPFNPDLPAINEVTGAPKKKRKGHTTNIIVVSPTSRIKSLGGHVIGGAGAGRFVAEWLAGRKLPRGKSAMMARRWWGATLGAAAGGSEFARKRVAEVLREKKRLEQSGSMKTAAAGLGPSPAQRIKATRQVGHFEHKIGRFGGAGPNALSRIAKRGL